MLHPFLHMFRDIIDFYERAGATEGREHWNLVVDQAELDLEHLRSFIRRWEAVQAELIVPAVDLEGAVALWETWSLIPSVGRVVIEAPRRPVPVGDPLTEAWLQDYRSGLLKPLPTSLAPEKLAPGFAELAALATAILDTALSLGPARASLRSYHQRPTTQLERDDAFSPSAVGHLESDSWLGAAISALAYARTLPPDDQGKLGSALKAALNAYPTRRHRVQLSFGDLAEILSLPVWRNRHELYAVWIGTEIVRALPEHECLIHHENGRIVFAFRETLVATITTARPQVRLIAERDQPLVNPVGRGRKANVQPDYGLWRNVQGTEFCGLIVEVKHYKKAARRDFAAVLTDYARAHTEAQVVLVNHGPVGNVLPKVASDVRARCLTLEHLTSGAAATRKNLRDVVRCWVGDPVRPATTIDGTGPATRIVAVDVSGSMQAVVLSPEFETFLAGVLDPECANVVAAIDMEVRAVIPFQAAMVVLRSQLFRPNSLGGPVATLLETYASVLVVSDEDGVRDLARFGNRTDLPSSLGLRLVLVSRD